MAAEHAMKCHEMPMFRGVLNGFVTIASDF